MISLYEISFQFVLFLKLFLLKYRYKKVVFFQILWSLLILHAQRIKNSSSWVEERAYYFLEKSVCRPIKLSLPVKHKKRENFLDLNLIKESYVRVFEYNNIKYKSFFLSAFLFN